MRRPSWARKRDPISFWVGVTLGALILVTLAYVVGLGAAHGAFR